MSYKYLVLTPRGPAFFNSSTEAKDLLKQGDFLVYVLVPTDVVTMEEDYTRSIGPLKTKLLEDLRDV